MKNIPLASRNSLSPLLTERIISADTDLIPVIEAVRELAPHTEVGIMAPLGQTNRELADCAAFRLQMSEASLARSQFPKEVRVGNAVVKRPDYEAEARLWFKEHSWLHSPTQAPHRGGLDA